MDSKLLEFSDLLNQITYHVDNISCTEDFIEYVKWVDKTYVLENKLMKKELNELRKEVSVLESESRDKDKQLSYLKLQINKARMDKASVEKERDNLRNKLKQVTKLLSEDSNYIEECTRATIDQITSTVNLNTPILYSGNHSIFSELSFSRESVDDISDEMLSEESFLRRKKKPLADRENVRDKTIAQPISSILKTKRAAPYNSFESSEEEFHSLGDTNAISPRSKQPRVCFATESIHTRPHNFVKHKSLIPSKCIVCSKMMSFQSDGKKCDVCKQVAHGSCQDQMVLPCVPASCTPVHLKKTISGKIAAYTPFVPPMIPGPVIHCINAVENTGLNQECLYKYEGHPEQIKDLLKELINDKKTKLNPLLHNASIHSICSALKEFFLSLDEHLIPASRWSWFSEVLEEEEKQAVQSHLLAGIADLPQPNRDTLAYIILHLQRVAESDKTKMTKHDLARVFGPIIIGTDQEVDGTANSKAVLIFEHLMEISSEIWNQYIVIASSVGTETPTMQDLRNTPTSDMALVQTINRRGLNTPYRTFTRSEQKKKYFKGPVFY